jgi:predicted ester cyclase
MSIVENKAIARSFFESYAQNNLDKNFDEYIAIGLVSESMGGKIDREKWKAFDKTFLAALSDFKVTVVEQVAENEKVVTHFTMEGRHTGEFAGMPASGNDIKLEAISIDVIKNSKIAEHLSIADFTAFMQQFVKKPLAQ